MRAIFAVTIASFLMIGKAPAHEMWIDALDYTVAPGTAIEGNLRVGEDFQGSPYSFLPNRFTRFDVTQGGATRNVERRLGDLPALRMEGLSDGLAIVAHETTPQRLTYSEWFRFVRFADHKDFGDIAAMQDARDLPREDFVESYTRHVKALIAVGSGAGSDARLGLRTEIVALANPYTDDLSQGLPVQVFYNGRALADVQVELFANSPSGEVTITLHRTNGEGITRLPVQPGFEYLADHVVLEAVEPSQTDDAVWHTYWAGLTFAVPQ